MSSIDAMIIRGGSSKGIYLNAEDLPPPGDKRDEVILKIFGSPDQRQIDGLGGADKLTSKVAVMGKPARPDCDVDYLFGQVNIELPRIDWKSNCGNISAGAALYGALLGHGVPNDNHVEIIVHQVNTGRRLRCSVPLHNGVPAVDGDFAIGGVPGCGARLDLDFFDFSGSALGGHILPTGQTTDRIDVPGVGDLDLSIVDMANLHIFVRAGDIGLDPTRTIFELQEDRRLVARLEAVRKAVAAELDFITGESADEELKVSMNPLIYAVTPPIDYQATNNTRVLASDQNITSRSLARHSFSKAYPGSGSAGTAVACGLKGTIAHEAFVGVRTENEPYQVKIGHPGGVLEVGTHLIKKDDDYSVQKAQLGRTARLLMDGKCYIR